MSGGSNPHPSISLPVSLTGLVGHKVSAAFLMGGHTPPTSPIYNHCTMVQAASHGYGARSFKCLHLLTTPMAHDPTPAIVRDLTDNDRDAEVLSTPADTVTFSHGWGDSGYRVEVVAYDCPADHCSFDRMVRRVDVSPETPTEVRYWCLNPNCAHFVGDSISYACHGSYPQRTASEPVVWESIHG